MQESTAASSVERPRRKRFLPFHVPSIGNEEIAAALEVLESGWLTTGRKARSFEESFARAVGARHAIAVNSGTAALHLALEAVGVGEDDEVIVPTMTFAATAEVVLHRGARLVLVDCEEDTLNLDPERLAAAITRRTSAVLPVHFAGHPCDMEPILGIARAKGLKVIEDAAHAFPAGYRGRAVGSIGDITCFSFYATKTITTGEGGMATTDDPGWAETMRLLSLHGISRGAWNRYAADGSWSYDILRPGYKYNLGDLAAAIGLEQLKKAERLREKRARIAEMYADGLGDVPELKIPRPRPDVRHAWHLYVIRLELERLRLDRGEFVAALKERNIGASVHFIPLHLHSYYRERYGYVPRDFPRASAAAERIVSLPIYPRMTAADVRDVIDAVRGVIARHRR